MRQWISRVTHTIPALLLVLVALIVLTAPENVLAETLTSKSIAPGFSCGGGGAELIPKGSCSDDPSKGYIFSYFVCEFENILADTVGDVYCAIVEEAKPAVNVALTMAVLFFGMMLLMGMSPFTAKELMIMAGKFSMVLAFAMEAEYMIGIGYKLFMTIAREGIIIVISHLFEGRNFQEIEDVFRMFDEFIIDLVSQASEEAKDDGAASATNKCKNAVFAMVALFVAAFPPLAIIALYFLVKLLWMVLRAMFGYCQGILGISFLVTLAPIYVSFALFKPTRVLFDKWIQFLVSFSFQMIIVFAFLGMIFSIAKQASDESQDYLDLVKPYNKQHAGQGTIQPWNYCGICKPAKTGPKEKVRCESEEALPATALAKDENFLQLASVKIIAMVILFYILDIMMDFVPQMARHLAGPKYAAQLGGGESGEGSKVSAKLPFEDSVGEFISGFVGGFKNGGLLTPAAVVKGLQSGTQQFVFGPRGVLASNTGMGIAFAAVAAYHGVNGSGSSARTSGSVARSSDPVSHRAAAADGNPDTAADDAAKKREIATAAFARKIAGKATDAVPVLTADRIKDAILAMRMASGSPSHEEIQRIALNAAMGSEDISAAIEILLTLPDLDDNERMALAGLIGRT